MKRHMALILALVAFAANFLCFWYNDSLLDRYFVLVFIPIGLSFFLLAVSLTVSIIFVVRHRSQIIHYIALTVSVFTVVVLFVFPFRAARVNLELGLYEEDRLEIVEMLKDGSIPTDNLGNAELPNGYRHLSSDGNVLVYKNDSEQVVSFWVFRGMLSGSVQVVYSSADESLICENQTWQNIVDIQMLKEHWYLVDTD